MARFIVRPQLKKTRPVNKLYFDMVKASGCPHCKTTVDLKHHHAYGGLVGICNNKNCIARSHFKAYYYVSETCERVFPLRLVA